MDLESTVRALEKRVGELEDRLAIYQLMYTYGPAADSGSAKAAAHLWTADGVYDVADVAAMTGHRELEQMYEGKTHQALIHKGAAHLTASPHVVINGDRAVATSTTARRRWTRHGALQHHLIDPRTGRPSASGVLSAR